MSVFTPEGISDQFGAIDSAAAEDGAPYSAHLLRAISKNSNRLVSKGHMLLNMVWSIEPDQNLLADGTPYGRRVADGPFRGFWSPMTSPINVTKKPGLTTGTAKIVARVAGTPVVRGSYVDNTVYFRVTTRATGNTTAPNNANVVQAQGTGGSGPDTYTITGIPLDPGPDEQIQLWCRAGSLDVPDLGDQATYGYPNTATLSTASANMICTEMDLLVLSSLYTGGTPSWNTTGDTYANEPHDLYFYNQAGALIALPLRIDRINTFIYQYHVAHFAGPLTRTERELVQDGGKFEIREAMAANCELFSLAVAADGRAT